MTEDQLCSSAISQKISHDIVVGTQGLSDQQVLGLNPIKAHWLEIFRQFKNMLEREYVNTRNSRIYCKKVKIKP